MFTEKLIPRARTATILLAVAFLMACSPQPQTLFMAGDSTMALKPLCKMVFDSVAGDSLCEPFPERGWGQMMPLFTAENLRVRDLAQNGRSTRTFIEQGWWQRIADSVRKGDFVAIQFGHNDAAKDKPDRYTPPDDYRANLLRFVNDVRRAGATPILCTPVVRRRFDGNGTFYDVHGSYPDIVRDLAKAESVPLVDMHSLSRQLVVDMGRDSSAHIFLHVAAGVNRNFPQGREDNTHFNERGATAMARLFVDDVKRQALPLAPYLKPHR